MAEITHWYLHVDLDAFFASVEQLDHSEYRGKPVIVGGKPEDRRSVVSTASYEARKFGVHSAMPTFKAYQLCPQGIYVHGRMERYAELSYEIMNIFREFSPDVQQMSIDEAFIDLTGTEKLFGPPEETALKIKKIVKDKTGLTVSVGLATTKYLAKIASGFSKPDGFYHILKGNEQDFMLSLPLNKVWGLGPKSLELLKKKGFNSTRDIYEKDFDLLQFLFGQNMATFLYETVRGKETSSFSRETKSHSISAETTFPYDLTDLYTIETELLELAHGVFFRLLKENSYSRTPFVKIRYDDFSTTTVQETSERNILTLDSYFEILKRLFEKKYDNTHGIRLIGVGFENIEKTERPYQQDLFENNDTKKQAVEKAILNLEKKHPEIKVRKARTFKDSGKLKALFLIPFLLFTPLKAHSKENTVTQNGPGATVPDLFYTPSGKEIEAPETLFNYEINDKDNVEFSLSGFWQVLFTDAFLFSFLEDSSPGFSLEPPVFKQEVELSAWVMLNNHWYFEADFAEEFKKNTLAIGYVGENFVRSARLSNRGITMASGYSAEEFGFGLQGGNNQAPGFNSHFQSPDNKFEADILLRYDMTETKSATFYGMTQVQDIDISPASFLYGYSYKFPDTAEDCLYQIENIYVETKYGSYSDSSGRKYKKLSTSDYFYSGISKRLYFSSSANAGKIEDFIPSVIITFTNPSNVNQIIRETGSYNNPGSFAGKIQEEFNTNSEKQYNLEDFTASPYTEIENRPGLIIQNSNGFSPYVDPSVYDCGLSTDAELLVKRLSSDLQLTEFISQQITNSSSVNTDFFQEKHLYTSIKNRNYENSSYPFASVSPEIYLNLPTNSDINIVLRTYSQITEYQIGTEACGGTVLVYKNNTLDTDASYNPNTGIVTLSSTPSASDKIYITWQEDSEDFSNGAIAGGLGAKYHFTPQLTGDFAITSRWPFSVNTSYATPDNIQNGFTAFSTGITYSNDNISISNKTAFSLQKDNASSGLLVCNQKNNTSSTYYLEKSSGHTIQNVPYIKTENNSIVLSEQNNGTIKNHDGISDSYISGYMIPVSWDFSDGKNWAAVDIQLSAGYLLHNSSMLNLALKPDLELLQNEITDIEVYLQLGCNTSEDYKLTSEPELPCWKLDTLKLNDSQWQTVSINISDAQRSKLLSSHDARLIITGTHSKGTIYVGPYEPILKSIETYQDSKILVTTYGIESASDDYTSVVNWSIPATTSLNELKDTNITTEFYFKESDFTSYENIEFEFSINGHNSESYEQSFYKDGFTLYLDSSNSVSQAFSEHAVELNITDISPYFSEYPVTHIISISLNENLLYIDGVPLDSQSYSLKINREIVPSKMQLIVNTVQNNKIYKNGQIFINKLIYTDTKLYTNLQNKFSFDYHHKDEIIKINEYDVVKNFNFGIISNQNLGNLTDPVPDINTHLESGITVADIHFQGDTQFNKTTLNNAGHEITSEKNILKLFNIKEQYRFSPQELSLRKSNGAGIDFTEYKIPVKLEYFTNAQDQLYTRNQNSAGSSAVNLELGDFGINWTLGSKFNQKQNKLQFPAYFFDYSNYFAGWSDISVYEFSSGEEDAVLRMENYETKLEVQIPFLEFKPNITYGLSGTYTANSLTQFNDLTNLSLNLPVTFSNHGVAFTLSRTGGDLTPINYGGSYGTDTNLIFDLQKDRLWIYNTAPFYELFAVNLKDSISADYSTTYELSYNRKLFNNIYDVFVPANASFAVQRDIVSNSDISDLYQYKAVITNTSLNNFGSNSQHQFFTWFKQEELITSISGTVKVPTDLPENTVFQITAYAQLLLLIADNNTLTSAIDYSLDSNLDWATHSTVIYSRPGESSFITQLINTIARKIINFQITRKDTFTIDISQTTDILNQKYYYNHGTDFNFMKYFTVTTGIGGFFSHIENKATNIGLEFSIGGKAEF